MAFDMFNLGVAQDKTLRNAYQAKIQAKGYNAVIDDNDRRKGIAQSPIIIFDRASSLRQVAKQEYAKGNELDIQRVMRVQAGQQKMAGRAAQIQFKDLWTRVVHSDTGGVDI